MKEEMSKAQPSEKMVMVVHLNRLAPYQRTAWDEQQGQLESKHHENQATGKEGEANHRCLKHSPRKRRNGGMPVAYLG
jgi:hypothetical protein